MNFFKITSVLFLVGALSSCASLKSYSKCKENADDSYDSNMREINTVAKLYGKSPSRMRKAYIETRKRMKEKCLIALKESF